eukprot:GHVR01020346.1.p1 GENE.GHVR01020346.1~~GHVR01020346.1.p1  ORF type:complete len:166 (+),score=46.18 GHVR01020346.1:294-791(+)
MYTVQRDQVNNQRIALEQQIMSLESAQTQQQAVAALRTGVTAQTQLAKKLNFGELVKLMDEVQDQKDLQDEIDDVFREHAQVADDDELLNELANLEAEELDLNLAEAAGVPSLAPVVPAGATVEPVGAHHEQAVAAQQGGGGGGGGARVQTDEEQLAELRAALGA